jgi:ADP-ribose pyrophosphatase YjhB (NUDIX family)
MTTTVEEKADNSGQSRLETNLHIYTCGLKAAHAHNEGNFVFYPHQKNVVQEEIDWINDDAGPENKRTAYHKIVTGGGKTVIFGKTINEFLKEAKSQERSAKALVAVPTQKLVTQTKERFEEIDSTMDVGMVYADAKKFDSDVTVLDGHLQVLIMKRANAPCEGEWSLVGGFIDIHKDKDIEATAKRKLEEKTGVKTPYLEQYGSIGNASRDPRGWSVTNVYFALLPHHKVHLQVGEGAVDIKWSAISGDKITDKLAFDHAEILKGCIERLRSKVLYTSLPVHLMPQDFTLRELQNVYEIILNQKLEHKSFRRRILSADILEETGEMNHERGRPAALYRSNTTETHFFMRNIEGAR